MQVSSNFRSIFFYSWNIPKPFQYRSEFRTVQPLPLGPSTKWNNRSLDVNIRLFPQMSICFSVPFRSGPFIIMIQKDRVHLWTGKAAKNTKLFVPCH